MTETTETDLVAEVEALLNTPNYIFISYQHRQLLHRLVEEVKALRAHVTDLNHDFDAMVKESDQAEEIMMRKMYGR